MPNPKELYILWTNDNILTSQLMVMKYATKSIANGWWDKVTVILWGAPVKLMAENETIQECFKIARHVGVEFSACIDCALQLDVADKLKALGIEPAPWGEGLTNIIQDGGHLINV